MSVERSPSPIAATTDRERRRLEQTIAHLPGHPRRVLDSGGGRGLLAGALRTRLPDAEVVLVDLSMSQVQQADAESRVVASIAALPFATGAFDLVISTEVLEHIPEASIDSAVRELSRVSRRDVIVTVPNDEDLTRAQVQCACCGMVYHPHGHQRSYRPKSLRRMVRGARVVKVVEVGERKIRLPSALLVALRRRGLVARPITSERCPRCGSADSEIYRGPRTFRSLLPQWRRPWLLMHFQVDGATSES